MLNAPKFNSDLLFFFFFAKDDDMLQSIPSAKLLNILHDRLQPYLLNRLYRYIGLFEHYLYSLLCIAI